MTSPSVTTLFEIGIISDTHGLLRPEALEALQGVSLILHAGDVGGAEIIAQLETVAPVKAVQGNCDTDTFGRSLPLEEMVQLGGVWIYLCHGHHPLNVDPRGANARVMVSGHTHVPRISEGEGVLWLNPGSAGPRRFRLPVTVARLKVNVTGEVEARLIDILGERENTVLSELE